MTAAFPTIPLREPRVQSTAPSLDGLAFSANRVALPADRKEADPTDPADEQGRQKEVVLAVVREYTRALERLDVHATKAVYPSVDARRLRRIVRGCRGTAVPVGLLRRVLFLIGTRRQRVVSWQFDLPAQNWIASHPIHGSGVGVQPGAGWGRMADSRGADSVDARDSHRSRATGRAGTFGHGGIRPSPARMRPPVPDARQPATSSTAADRGISAPVDVVAICRPTRTADTATDPPTAHAILLPFAWQHPAARSGVSSRRRAAPHPSTSR